MSRYSRLGWSLLVGGLAFTLGATTASAQGRGKGHEKQEDRARDRDDDHDRDVRVRHDDRDRRVVVVRRDDDRARDRDRDRDRERDTRMRHQNDHDRVVVVRRDDDHDRRGHVPPGHAKRHYTSVEAVGVTRDVMRRHGYEVERVERHGDDQVIYYYRGNMGRGRGHGPLERMVIHPDHERIIVRQAPPSAVWTELRAALGL